MMTAVPLLNTDKVTNVPTKIKLIGNRSLSRRGDEVVRRRRRGFVVLFLGFGQFIHLPAHVIAQILENISKSSESIQSYHFISLNKRKNGHESDVNGFNAA